MYRSTSKDKRSALKSGHVFIADDEERSLRLELTSIETHIKDLAEQKKRSVKPFYTPPHIVKETEILEELASRIRKLLREE